MATTANTITDAAYRKCSIQDPSSGEDDNALEALNNMISTWGLDYTLPFIVRESHALTIGQAEYTIGSGGDFDTVRPLGLSSVYLEDVDGYSYQVAKMSPREYNRIGTKTLEARPTKVYYIPEYADTTLLAKMIFNKEPDVAYTAYFEFWKGLTEFAAKTTVFAFPNEFKEAMVYNLAIKLAEDNGIDLPQSVITTALTLRFLIARLLASNRQAPKARFDFNGAVSNIVTDE